MDKSDCLATQQMAFILQFLGLFCLQTKILQKASSVASWSHRSFWAASRVWKKAGLGDLQGFPVCRPQGTSAGTNAAEPHQETPPIILASTCSTWRLSGCEFGNAASGDVSTTVTKRIVETRQPAQSAMISHPRQQRASANQMQVI